VGHRIVDQGLEALDKEAAEHLVKGWLVTGLRKDA
jgi:hypothetical protein